MFFLRLIITALRSLESHFLRSLLATLGVLIGVGSVVACMSIVEGATREIIQDLKALGSNVLLISPAIARIEGRPAGMAQSLVTGDIDQLLRELPEQINAIAPEALGTSPVKRLQKSDTFTVVATSDMYFQIHSFEPRCGRVFDKSEANDELASVVCLGSKVAEKLFGGAQPIGQAVKIGNTAYRVIGVMEKRGNIVFLNADDAIFIPIKAGLKRFFNRRYLHRMTIQARDGVEMDDLEKQVARVLRREHHIRVGQEDDFETYTQEEVLRQVSEFTIIFRIVFYSIAGISLVVGGIGIMNIMLVSVTERTREIGVRIAVGARRGDILLQFLVESLIISLLGGSFGLLLGMMFSDLLDKVLQGIFKTEVSTGVIIVALATATVVGVLSGLYPAFKASRLDPVEALRYE
jgi:putative ABC transport system permease protein